MTGCGYDCANAWSFDSFRHCYKLDKPGCLRALSIQRIPKQNLAVILRGTRQSGH